MTCALEYMVGARVEIMVALNRTGYKREGHETIVLSQWRADDRERQAEALATVLGCAGPRRFATWC